MTDPYANIRKALDAYDTASARGHKHKRGLAYLDFRDACDPDTIRELLAERDALAEGLTATEKDVAVAQAVEFAEYVERQAKGAMRDAAKRFLSLPYSQEIAERLKERDALAQENEAMRRCAIKYLTWLDAVSRPPEDVLREDMANPDMCGDAAIAAASGGTDG